MIGMVTIPAKARGERITKVAALALILGWAGSASAQTPEITFQSTPGKKTSGTSQLLRRTLRMQRFRLVSDSTCQRSPCDRRPRLLS